MKIKLLNLSYPKSNALYGVLSLREELELDDCYLYTLFVAKYLKSKGRDKGIKVAIGFMQSVSDTEKGCQEGQSNTFVRHAFLVDKDNKVIDIEIPVLNVSGVETAPPKYIAMKKYTIDEYLEIVHKLYVEMLDNNTEKMDITLKGLIPHESKFIEDMREAGYTIVPTTKEQKK